MVERKCATYLRAGQIDSAGGAKMTWEDLCMPKCELWHQAVSTLKSCMLSLKPPEIVAAGCSIRVVWTSHYLLGKVSIGQLNQREIIPILGGKF